MVYIALQGFGGVYSYSSKEPEGFILPLESKTNLPTIAVETGWSESWPILLNEKDLWLVGGAPEVQLVFLIVWTQLDGDRVQGDLYVYGRDVTGAPRFMQAEVSDILIIIIS
jgi:hypothetical protein